MRKRIIDKVARKKREKSSSDSTTVKTMDGHESLFRKVETIECVMKKFREKKQSSPEIFHTIHCSHYELSANAVPHFAEKRWPIVAL